VRALTAQSGLQRSHPQGERAQSQNAPSSQAFPADTSAVNGRFQVLNP
jgi:hypothetical protein